VEIGYTYDEHNPLSIFLKTKQLNFTK